MRECPSTTEIVGFIGVKRKGWFCIVTTGDVLTIGIADLEGVGSTCLRTATSSTFMINAVRFNASGVLFAYRFYCVGASPVFFQVWRPQASLVNYTLVCQYLVDPDESDIGQVVTVGKAKLVLQTPLSSKIKYNRQK